MEETQFKPLMDPVYSARILSGLGVKLLGCISYIEFLYLHKAFFQKFLILNLSEKSE